jgi:SAM-dependent MidA family methyltransferase
VPQAQLLLSLGIQARAQALADGARSAEAVAAVQAAFDRLVGSGPEGMGATYQAMAIVQRGLPPPVGFDVAAGAPVEAGASGGGGGGGGGGSPA